MLWKIPNGCTARAGGFGIAVFVFRRTGRGLWKQQLNACHKIGLFLFLSSYARIIISKTLIALVAKDVLDDVQVHLTLVPGQSGSYYR